MITDSAASLPADVAAELDVIVVPLHLIVGGEDRLDGDVSLSAALAADDVSTSAPSPGEFLAAIEARDAPDGTLIVTIAADMSATYKSAWLASTGTDGVRVIDSKTAAGAQGLVVIAAANAARAGASLDEVERVANDVCEQVQLVAAVDGLDHLVRSGRVPGLAGWAGNLLGLQPLFAFRGGRVRRLRPSNSRRHALDRIVHEWHRTCPDGGADLHLAALHALAEDDVRYLVDEVSATVQPATCFVGEFSPVMVTHTGPGLVGLAWWWEHRR